MTQKKKMLLKGNLPNESDPQLEDAIKRAWNLVPNPILVTRHDGEIIFSNTAAVDLFSDHGEKIGTRNINDILIPLHIDHHKLSGQFSVAMQQNPILYLLAFDKGKTVRHVSLQSTQLADDQQLVNIYSLFDMESLAIELDRVQKLANIDQLTGAYSRRYFYELLDKEMERVERYNTELSLIMIDIDNFKLINDNYGHLVGDKILRKFSDLINMNLRDVDIFGRLGGDEFAIVLPETRLNKAQSTAQRIKRLITRQPFVVSVVEPISVTMSMGVTTTRPDIRNGEQLINFADQALYNAKYSGRNTIKSGFFPEAKIFS